MDSFFGLGSMAASPVNPPPLPLPRDNFGRFFAGSSESSSALDAADEAEGGGRSRRMRTGPLSFAFFGGCGAGAGGVVVLLLGAGRFREDLGGGRPRRDVGADEAVAGFVDGLFCGGGEPESESESEP